MPKRAERARCAQEQVQERDKPNCEKNRFEKPIDSWKNVVFKLQKNYQHLDDHLLGTLVD